MLKKGKLKNFLPSLEAGASLQFYMITPNSVDVALHVYGKPLLTAVAISSLLAKSGKWINKVYLIAEKKQPYNEDFDFIERHFKGKVITYKPHFYFGLQSAKPFLFGFPWYRWSIRYQYAFEKSTMKYLYIIHNDVLFHKDILDLYLREIKTGNFAGVGPIGMCWNCPASYAGLCDPDHYTEYKPSEKEFADLNEKYPAPRTMVYDHFRNGREIWPLPECRLNEWSALVDREQVGAYQYPNYKEIIFGQMYLDIAVRWFHHLNNKGLKFKNVPLGDYATHVWTGKEGELNSGVDTLNNKELYLRAEKISYEKLIEEFGFTESELAKHVPSGL